MSLNAYFKYKNVWSFVFYYSDEKWCLGILFYCRQPEKHIREKRNYYVLFSMFNKEWEEVPEGMEIDYSVQ